MKIVMKETDASILSIRLGRRDKTDPSRCAGRLYGAAQILREQFPPPEVEMGRHAQLDRPCHERSIGRRCKEKGKGAPDLVLFPVLPRPLAPRRHQTIPRP